MTDISREACEREFPNTKQPHGEMILALRAALDRAEEEVIEMRDERDQQNGEANRLALLLAVAEADKAAAVEAERERCLTAALAALEARKASYTRKRDRAQGLGSDDASLYDHLVLSQDYAKTAVSAAIRNGGTA